MAPLPGWVAEALAVHLEKFPAQPVTGPPAGRAKPAAVLVPIGWYEETAAVLDSAADGPARAHDPEERP